MLQNLRQLTHAMSKMQWSQPRSCDKRFSWVLFHVRSKWPCCSSQCIIAFHQFTVLHPAMQILQGIIVSSLCVLHIVVFTLGVQQAHKPVLAAQPAVAASSSSCTGPFVAECSTGRVSSCLRSLQTLSEICCSYTPRDMDEARMKLLNSLRAAPCLKEQRHNPITWLKASQYCTRNCISLHFMRHTHRH